MRRKSHRWRKFSRRTLPGEAPGTIVSDPAAPRPRITVMAYGPGPDGVAGLRVERECATPEEAASERGKGSVIWVNVDGLGDAETITKLGDLFGLHKLAMEDVVNTHQRAKVEAYGDVVFVVLREALFADHLEMDQISMFIGSDFLVTFQEQAGDSFGPVRERIRKAKGRICTERPDYLAYALLDAVIDAYYPVLEKYGEKLELLEDETIEHATRSTVEHIHDIKRDFLTLRRAIWPAREAMSTLIREELPNVRPEVKVYFRDCYDHLVQLIDMLETYRETGSDLMEVYLSSVSNRMNEIMKVLTIISTLFMPLSFVAGVYGMNFNTGASRWNMPELNWKYGYFFCLGVMAAITIGMLGYFRHKGWMGGPRKR
jgi:magnesium transporter